MFTFGEGFSMLVEALFFIEKIRQIPFSEPVDSFTDCRLVDGHAGEFAAIFMRNFSFRYLCTKILPNDANTHFSAKRGGGRPRPPFSHTRRF